MPLFVSIAAIMVITVGILISMVPENKRKKELAEELENDVHDQEIDDAQVGEESKKKTILPPAVKKSFIFMLVSIFLWFMAYNAVTTAFSRYTRVVWKLEGGSFANCLMVATVAAIISYIPFGHVASK